MKRKDTVAMSFTFFPATNVLGSVNVVAGTFTVASALIVLLTFVVAFKFISPVFVTLLSIIFIPFFNDVILINSILVKVVIVFGFISGTKVSAILFFTLIVSGIDIRVTITIVTRLVSVLVLLHLVGWNEFDI